MKRWLHEHITGRLGAQPTLTPRHMSPQLGGGILVFLSLSTSRAVQDFWTTLGVGQSPGGPGGQVVATVAAR
jgi:hypothetical protein